MGSPERLTSDGSEVRWESLLDGRGTSGWLLQGEPSSFAVEQGILCASGQPATLVFAGGNGLQSLRDFELEATCRGTGSLLASLHYHTRLDDIDPSPQVLINQDGRRAGGRGVRAQTGSLHRVRNLYKRWIRDDQRFRLRLRSQAAHVSIWLDDVLLVDCLDSNAAPGASGTIAIRWHGGDGRLYVHGLRIRALDSSAPSPTPVTDATDSRLAALQAREFPLIDLHVHLKGLSLDQAVAHGLRTGINLGIAPNCGMIWQGLPGVTADSLISDDAGLNAFRARLSERPVFLGLQGEGREWAGLFSPQARRAYDYVFTDCLTFDDARGRRIRLWIPEEVQIDEAESFMDLYVEKIVSVIRSEPIDLFVNPTFLPECIADRYEALWTAERMDRVIEALALKGLPLEINARFRIPSPAFIRRAKQAGLRFSFGTNNVDADLGRLEYCLEMIDSCGLTAEDMYIPN